MQFVVSLALVVCWLGTGAIAAKMGGYTKDKAALPCSGKELTDNRNFCDPAAKCSGKFYSCPEGADYATPRDCPRGLVFDVVSDQCLVSKYVEACPDGVATTTEETPTTPVADETAPTSPPYVFDCVGRRSGNYPNPNKPCSNIFSSCVSGVLVIRECPSELYYNPKTGDCDMEQYVETCGGVGTTRPPKDAPTKPPAFDANEVDCIAERGDYFVPNPDNRCSSRYYSCASGVARRLECPRPLVFDVLSSQCLSPVFTEACGGSSTTTTEYTPSEQAGEAGAGADGAQAAAEDLGFDCSDKDDGNFPLGDCEPDYIACVAGQASRFACPSNLKYSAEADACLPNGQVASCPDAGLPGNVCQGKVDGFYPLNCEQYVFCSAQEPFVQVCPEGTVFHPTNNRCVQSEECIAPCGSKADPPPFDCTTRPVGFYTRGDCAEYFYCEPDNSTWTFECSPGFAFDVRVNECLPKVRVPECIPQAPAVDQQPFCLRRLNGLHPHPDDCHYAIVCLTGVAFELPCPTAQYPRFDPEIGNCNVATDSCKPDANQRSDIGLIIVDATYRGLVTPEPAQPAIAPAAAAQVEESPAADVKPAVLPEEPKEEEPAEPKEEEPKEEEEPKGEEPKEEEPKEEEPKEEEPKEVTPAVDPYPAAKKAYPADDGAE